MARTEPDPEIQDLLRKSTGLNLALDYLPAQPRLASAIVWLDALVTNADRTAKNTNLLIWHAWNGDPARAASAFPQIREHVSSRAEGRIRERGCDSLQSHRALPRRTDRAGCSASARARRVDRCGAELPRRIQTSPVHSGMNADRAAALAHLFQRLVR